MIVIRWTGHVVTDNERHALRWVWKNGVKVQVQSPKREYQQFVEDLSMLVMAEARRHGYINLPSVSLRMQCHLGPQHDDQNLLKPVCDAIERGGVVANDRDIGYKVIVPATRHAKGKLDEILLLLSKEKEPVLTDAGGTEEELQ